VPFQRPLFFCADVPGNALPEVYQYYSALLKYGVHDPVACTLLAFGLPSRKLALEVSEYFDSNQLSPYDLIEWLLNNEPTDPERLGFSVEIVYNFILHIHKHNINSLVLLYLLSIIALEFTPHLLPVNNQRSHRWPGIRHPGGNRNRMQPCQSLTTGKP